MEPLNGALEWSPLKFQIIYEVYALRSLMTPSVVCSQKSEMEKSEMESESLDVEFKRQVCSLAFNLINVLKPKRTLIFVKCIFFV